MKYFIKIEVEQGTAEIQDLDVLDIIISNLEYDGYKVIDSEMLTEKEVN